MPYYEVVFETGRTSVIEGTEEEVLEAARNQDERARSGKQGGPQGGPAERIVKMYEYDKPPNDYNVDQTASAEVVVTEIAAIVEKLKDSNGVVSIPAIAAEVQRLSHPMVAEKANPHDSNFKMESKKELTLDEPTAKGSK